METGPLDYKIMREELTDALLILKQGKAPGLDSVLNEMISCSVKYYPRRVFLFAKLFLSIVNNRLLNYCIQNKILAPNQL